MNPNNNESLDAKISYKKSAVLGIFAGAILFFVARIISQDISSGILLLVTTFLLFPAAGIVLLNIMDHEKIISRKFGKSVLFTLMYFVVQGIILILGLFYGLGQVT